MHWSQIYANSSSSAYNSFKYSKPLISFTRVSSTIVYLLSASATLFYYQIYTSKQKCLHIAHLSRMHLGQIFLAINYFNACRKAILLVTIEWRYEHDCVEVLNLSRRQETFTKHEIIHVITYSREYLVRYLS